jgi:hypothetical protein
MRCDVAGAKGRQINQRLITHSKTKSVVKKSNGKRIVSRRANTGWLAFPASAAFDPTATVQSGIAALPVGPMQRR